MSKVWLIRIVIALAAGLIVTVLSLLILPKDSVTVGPSCPICEDVNGGRYHHSQYGWPLRFLYRDDMLVADKHGIIIGNETRKTGKIPQLVADLALWSAVSFGGVLLVTRRRRT